MHYLEYCYCLITIIIVSVLIVIIIIYNHYYYHYHDYHYHHHCYYQYHYHHLMYCYIMYHLEYDSENKLVSTLTFRELFTNLTQKVMPTSKTEMKSKNKTDLVVIHLVKQE